MSMLACPALAQWVNVPQAGTPRTPDGKPDLTAPVPRTPDGKPDLSGIWRRPRGSQPATGGTDGIGAGIATGLALGAIGGAYYGGYGYGPGYGYYNNGCIRHRVVGYTAYGRPIIRPVNVCY